MDGHYREIVKATRRLLKRRGITITEAAKLARIPRTTPDKALNLRASMPHRYWWQLWHVLGVSDAMGRAIVRALDSL